MTRIIAFAAALLLAGPSFAQQTPEKTYTLTVTDADLFVIGEGLGEVASKRANPVIVKLNQQISTQRQQEQANPKDGGK